MSYGGCEFWAERTRRNGRLSGTVLVVNRSVRNGESFLALGLPVDGRKALPIATWASDSYLSRKNAVKITEAQAREIAPEMFKAIDAHERSPEYRAMYAAEISKPGRSPLQPAFPAPHQVRTNVTETFYRLYGPV
jgi:hypothetical protein